MCELCLLGYTSWFWVAERDQHKKEELTYRVSRSEILNVEESLVLLENDERGAYIGRIMALFYGMQYINKELSSNRGSFMVPVRTIGLILILLLSL